MIIWLDTVTLSAFRKRSRADPKVFAWQGSLNEARVAVSVITLNEIRFGLCMIEKKDPVFGTILAKWYQNVVSNPARYHIITVSRIIAEVAADFRYHFKMGYNDSLIAATAEKHGLTLATRNIKDFQDCGISLVNPWEFEEGVD